MFQIELKNPKVKLKLKLKLMSIDSITKYLEREIIKLQDMGNHNAVQNNYENY